MKKVGFIGACDKTNLILYIAKVLENLDKKVLVIDTTITQKTKYVVPAINPTKSYITDFENIDFAIGFENIQEIIRYLGKEDMAEVKLPYDYVLLDIDREMSIENFDIEESKDNYFVTTFDIYSLRRGVEILKNLPETMNLSKILYNYDIKKEDEEYLKYLSMDTKVIWNDFSIYLPIIDSDNQMMDENQRVYRARLKKLSPDYQEGIIYIVQDIVKELNVNKIRKMVKE